MFIKMLIVETFIEERVYFSYRCVHPRDPISYKQKSKQWTLKNGTYVFFLHIKNQQSSPKIETGYLVLRNKTISIKEIHQMDPEFMIPSIMKEDTNI